MGKSSSNTLSFRNMLIQFNTSLNFRITAFLVIFITSIAISAFPVSAYGSNVMINEIHSKGADDLVELYNPTIFSIDVTSWSVHDSTSGVPKKSPKFSATSIPANGYITVDMDNILSDSGDTIKLYDSPDNTGNLIDTISYPSLVINSLPTATKTASRQFDGSVNWVLQTATLGSSNGSKASFEVIPATIAQTPTKVYPTDLANTWTTWTYHDDIKDSSDPLNAASPTGTNEHNIVDNPEAANVNKSVVKLGSGASQKFNLATLLWSGKKLSDLSSLQFDIYTDNPGSAYINMDLNFNSWGADKWVSQNQAYNHGRLIHVPNVTAGTWSNHDPIANNGLWTWSQYDNNNGVWPDGNPTRFRTWTDITSSFPNAYISSTLKQLALAYIPYSQNKPIPFLPFGGIFLRADNNTVAYYDNVVLATANSNNVYDFSRLSDETITGPSIPSISNNSSQATNPNNGIPTGSPAPTNVFTNFSAIQGDGFVSATPIPQSDSNTETENQNGEVLGAQDTFANEAANFAGANTKSGISKGLLWLLIASGVIGTIIAWFLLARRRQGNE